YDVDGVTRLPVGSTYLGQLYAGPDSNNLQPVGAAVPVGPVPGVFVGGTRTITTVAPGQVASVQVRVWESAYGNSYEQTRLNGGKTGLSSIVQIQTGDPTTYPPTPPAALTGIPNFALVP